MLHCKLEQNLKLYPSYKSDRAINEMFCDARELANKIDIPANFELTQQRHRVRRRNVNFDYEERKDSIEDPTLKDEAEFYFFTLEIELSMHLNPDIYVLDLAEEIVAVLAKLNKKWKSNRNFKIHIEPGFYSKSRYNFKDIAYSPNKCDNFKQSETGLPQGTVISPILFNIFINDLPDLLASDGLTNTALFADDLAIWCSTPKRDQSKLNTILNLTLERLHLWCIENNMTVNLKKTTCQFFTLNRQPFSPQLVYNGMPVQQSDVSIYLGCALDNKLKWTKHAELVVSKARKRLSILKRLTGVKWGCNRDTLNTTYKTYFQPVLNYCNEVLISASENVRKLLDTFHNQALRMITGGVKTTPVLAMQLLCDLQPFTNIIEKNAAILFNRLIRLPNNSFWRDYDSDGGLINDVLFELLSFANPLDYAILDIRLDLVLNVRKRDLSPTALHAIALETINTRFPPEEWLHIYTDGSLLDFAQGAGIGVFSHLFSFYLHAGPLTTHFDGEVEAIHIALQQLAVRLPPIERAVILSDSTSALQALSNYNENNCLRVQNCRELLGKIKGKINFRRDLTLHSAKLEIKRIFRESFRLTASRVARDKPWSTLCKKSHGIPSSPRAAAVAKFRLLTGHDCLCAHLFRFNLVTSPICVLCDTGQDMTAAHLDECSALNDLNCILFRYSCYLDFLPLSTTCEPTVSWTDSRKERILACGRKHFYEQTGRAQCFGTDPLSRDGYADEVILSYMRLFQNGIGFDYVFMDRQRTVIEVP
ncbi:uncharacterized protein LOC103524116 [Trichonephila clavipes]|nr:uncharacterized protein LOC103524116 [Trichonephila clavipes]